MESKKNVVILFTILFRVYSLNLCDSDSSIGRFKLIRSQDEVDQNSTCSFSDNHNWRSYSSTSPKYYYYQVIHGSWHDSIKEIISVLGCLWLNVPPTYWTGSSVSIITILTGTWVLQTEPLRTCEGDDMHDKVEYGSWPRSFLTTENDRGFLWWELKDESGRTLRQNTECFNYRDFGVRKYRGSVSRKIKKWNS